MSMPEERVVFYADAQNIYRRARGAFCNPVDPGTEGQVDHVAIAQLVCSRPPAGVVRKLAEVRVYTGRPESSKDPATYGAHMRQCAAWERAGAIVIPRTLRYPFGYPGPGLKPQEKGIDVALAIDFVMGAVDGRYDVGIIFSTDTDLRPALEAVLNRYHGTPKVETVAWSGPGVRNRLAVLPPRRNWTHWLTQSDFNAVRDRTDYNIP